MKIYPLVLLLPFASITAHADFGQAPDVILPPVSRCHAPGPDQCWDMTGQGRYHWDCDHCVTVDQGSIEKASDDCAQQIHRLSKRVDQLNNSQAATSCGAAMTDNKYPSLKTAANGLDSVAGAYQAGVQASSDAETSAASLATTANNPSARICAISKAVDSKAAETEDKLVNAEANLNFVPELDRLGQAIAWQSGSGTVKSVKPCLSASVGAELQNSIKLIQHRCLYSTSYAKMKSSVSASRKNVSSLKKTLKDQCLREKSLGDSLPGVGDVGGTGTGDVGSADAK